MRYLILSLLLVPATVSFHGAPKHQPTGVGYGRGYINPPTVAQMQEVKCLATMVYGEARGEKKIGQIAVAYSAMNRAQGTKSLCDVVLAPKQYSVFNNNPELRRAALSLNLPPARKNKLDVESWKNAVQVAEEVAHKKVPDPTKGSTHYLAPKVMDEFGYPYPEWSRQYKLVAVIDNHRFYKPNLPKAKNDSRSSAI